MQVLRKAFKQQLDPFITEFVASIDADKELVLADLKGSIAHARMLTHCGLLTAAQGAKIEGGLQQLQVQAAAGGLTLQQQWEDVHMNVEKLLEELIGEDALRLHTARSRNDQVALDLRLYTIEQIDNVLLLLAALQKELLTLAKKNADVVMPGYTHLQRAQPVSFKHALLAFVEMLKRDEGRFLDCKKRTAVSPLGAGAQAGTALATNPAYTAKELGFVEQALDTQDAANRSIGAPKLFGNSIDAVSDRDFAVEFLSACSMTAVHLSQMAETFVIWGSNEFGFIQFEDSVTTSSSLMPQKKNPDPVEIVRGKTGFCVGELVNLLVTLKSLPLGYNRDLQETKPPVIRAAKSLAASLKAMAIVVPAISVDATRTLLASSDPDLMATDLVEYLVLKSVPFRQAHEAVAELVQLARDNSSALTDLTLAQYQSCHASFAVDVFALFDPVASFKSKTSHGGPGASSN
jgi:argininosuccinate lyase